MNPFRKVVRSALTQMFYTDDTDATLPLADYMHANYNAYGYR